MKKRLKMIMAAILIGTLACVAITIVHNYIVKKKNEETIKNTSYYKECELINKYDTNIMIYGEENRKFTYLNPTFLKNINEFNISSNFNVLVINDLYSETTVSDSIFEQIESIIKKGDNKLMFIYYGNLKYDKLTKYSLVTTSVCDDTLGVVYGPSIYHSSICYRSLDFEDESKYPDLFEKSFASLIVQDYIKEVLA